MAGGVPSGGTPGLAEGECPTTGEVEALTEELDDGLTLAGEAAPPPLEPGGGWSRLRAEAGGLAKSSLVRTIAAFFGSNVVALVVRVVSGLLVTRWAGPQNMGYVLAVSAVLPYAKLVRLGVLHGTARQLPLLLGRGEREHALRVANAGWWWTRLSSRLLGVGCAAVGTWLLLTGQVQLGVAWLLYAVLAPVQQLGEFVQATYRTSGDFLKLSRIRILEALLAVATVGLLLVSPWWGLLARLFVLGASEYLLLRLWQPLPLASRLDGAGLRESVRIGLPMFVVAYIQGILNNIDRTLMLVLVGSSALGMYAPALQISIAAMVLPQSIQQVLYPRMCKIYGRTGTPRSLAKMAFGPATLLAFALLPVFAAGWWLVDPFIRTVLPRFVDGISAAQWMLVLLYFRSLGTPRIVFNVVNRQDLLAGITIAAIAVSGAAAWLLVRHSDLGLAAVPAGCAVGAFAYNLAGSLLAGWLVFRRTAPEPASAR